MLRYLTAGESHGPQLTAILEGMPAGLPISLEAINQQLHRRQQGYGRGGRMQIETDRAEFVGGVRHGRTTGAPIALRVENKDWANWSRLMDPFDLPPDDLSAREERLLKDTSTPRPGHADLAGGIKYGHHDLRNVLERASARETAARVAVGSITRLLLAELGIELASHVVRLGPAALPDEFERPDPASINATADDSPVRCLDPQTAEAMIAAVKEAGKASDTLGGVAEIVVGGLPVGLGSHVHWDRKLDGRLAGALMAVPSVKGVEIGLGFANAERPGSRVHDEIVADADKSGPRRGFRRLTNNAGGLEGGITNGERLVLRAAGKPISTLMKPLRTVDVRTGEPAEAMTERSDIVVTPALGVVCEAVVCLVLADAIVEKFGGDTLGELKHNFESYLLSEY